MPVIIGVILTLALLVGIVVFARSTADPLDAPSGRPPWMGADPVAIADALRSAVAKQHPHARDRSVDELARHHAHDMAARNYCHEVDPEGVDLAERRRRLAPDLAALIEEWDFLVHTEGSGSAQRLAAELLPGGGEQGERLRELLGEERWTEIGVGVGAEHRRCAATLVFASVAGRVTGTRAIEEPGREGWELRGRAAEAVNLAELSAAMLDQGGGVLCSAAAQPADEDEPERGTFVIFLPQSPPQAGFSLELRRDGLVVWRGQSQWGSGPL